MDNGNRPQACFNYGRSGQEWETSWKRIQKGSLGFICWLSKVGNKISQSGDNKKNQGQAE